MEFKELRKKCGFKTQESLAKALNVSRATISMWEIGLSNPTLSKIKKISDILKIDDLKVINCFKKSTK